MKNYTDITVILDRSGSMASVKDTMEEVLNGFVLTQQLQDGECKFTLVQFDDRYELVVSNTDIKCLGSFKIEPRGSTALYDAIGRTVDETGKRLAAMPESERPNKVIVVIVTDGAENASTKYKDGTRLFEMVRHQQDTYNWQFIFLGANQDAIAAAGRIGIARSTTLNYNNTERSVKAMGMSLCSAVGAYRSTGSKRSLESEVKTYGGALNAVCDSDAKEWDDMLEEAKKKKEDNVSK